MRGESLEDRQKARNARLPSSEAGEVDNETAFVNEGG